MAGDTALTTKEVAKFLNVSHQMVYNMIKAQEIPAFKVGSAVRVLHSDLLQYVQSRKSIFSAQNRNLDNQNESLFVVNSLSVRTGTFRLDNISFSLPRGKIMALLGASGSGKTLLLRTIAGIEPKEAGSIFLGGTCLDALSTPERRIGFVYQDYALFPYMRSRENIAFPLHIMTKDREEIDAKVSEVVHELRISDTFLQRYPDQLPEGIKQLIAIGREKAHLFELFIMDEPMTHLDAHVRTEMRVFIKQIVRKLDRTTIIALNSPEDALALSDYCGILHRGRLIQFGPTSEVYAHPHSSAAMDALSPLGVNYVLAEVVGGVTEPYGIPCAVPDGMYVLAFRPEEIEMSDHGITAEIKKTSFYDGNRVLAFCETGDGRDLSLVVPVKYAVSSHEPDDGATPTNTTVTFVPTHPVFFS